jgi:hypothetical protein
VLVDEMVPHVSGFALTYVRGLPEDQRILRMIDRPVRIAQEAEWLQTIMLRVLED